MDGQKIQLRREILEGTVKAFHGKGIKFTMDDVAKELSISKKTIYTIFPDKETMFLAMVDFLFDGIKDSEQAVCSDTTLSTTEKIRKILGVMPDSYRNVDFRQLYVLKSKYPAIYKRVEERLENGWENTIALLEQGMREGVIKPVKIAIIKVMLEATLEQFFQRDILLQNGITYVEALEEVVNVIMEGIIRKEG